MWSWLTPLALVTITVIAAILNIPSLPDVLSYHEVEYQGERIYINWLDSYETSVRCDNPLGYGSKHTGQRDRLCSLLRRAWTNLGDFRCLSRCGDCTTAQAQQ